MITLNDKWELANRRPSGFDFLRIALSTAIMLWHTIIVCYGIDAQQSLWGSPIRPLIYFLVPSFFALSGFLVTGSLVKNKLTSFFTLRAIRIFPALAVEVFISALIIGPAFTELTLWEYFTRKEFYGYFLNIVGFIHYRLPEVFNFLPEPRVNVQLWTIPYELDCYLALGVLALTQMPKRPKLFAALTFSLAIAAAVFSPDTALGPPTGNVIVLSFLSGVSLFLCMKIVPYSLPALCGAIILFIQLVWTSGGAFFASISIAYITVWFGLTSFNCRPLRFLANYSYGIFLYSVPIQQVVCSLFPEHRDWYFNFLVAYPLTLFCAAMSWHGLESRILKRKDGILAALPSSAGLRTNQLLDAHGHKREITGVIRIKRRLYGFFVDKARKLR